MFLVVGGECLLNSDRALHRVRHGLERSHQSVADVFDFPSSSGLKAIPDQRIVHVHQMERLRISVEHRHTRRIFEVRKHNRAEARVYGNSGGFCDWRGWRVFDPAQKSLDHSGINLDDFVWNQAVGLVMSAFDRLAVRRLDETKRRAAYVIEPVGQKLYVILVLDREILLVRVRDGMARCSFDVVAIHINRHSSTRMLEIARKLDYLS